MATTTDPIGNALARGLDDILRERRDRLAESAGIQVMAHALLEHETRRVESKLGKSHRRTRQLQARLDTARTQIDTLVAERERNEILVPEVAGEDALIHGRTLDKDGRAIADLMVCLTDRNGTPVRVGGEPTTDDSGYFAFTLSPDVINRLREEFEAGVFLAVFTGDGATRIHLEPKPLALDKGVRLVEEIVLSRGQLLATGSSNPPQPDRITVPDLVGQPEEAAVVLLERLELKLGDRKSRPVQEQDQVGRVLAQAPKAGTVVCAGSSVELVIGAEEIIEVPQVVGMKLAGARRKIRASRLEVGKIRKRESDTPGRVMEQDPKAREKAPAGTEVNLLVARKKPG